MHIASAAPSPRQSRAKLPHLKSSTGSAQSSTASITATAASAPTAVTPPHSHLSASSPIEGWSSSESSHAPSARASFRPQQPTAPAPAGTSHTHPLNGTLRVQPEPLQLLPFTPRRDDGEDEKTSEQYSTAQALQQQQQQHSFVSHAAPPLMLPSGRSAGGPLVMPTALASLTTPSPRPPVVVMVDPRVSGHATARPATTTSTTPFRPSTLASLSARSHSHSSHGGSGGPLDPIRTSGDLDRWISRARTAEENAAQLRFLLHQTQLAQLELQVLRRQSNHFKDSEVEAMLSSRAALESQLKLAEEDIAILLREKKTALGQVASQRRSCESLQDELARRELERDDARAETAQGAALYAKTSLELEQLHRSHAALQSQADTLAAQLAACARGVQQRDQQLDSLRQALDHSAHEKAEVARDRDSWKSEAQTTQVREQILSGALADAQRNLALRVEELAHAREEARERGEQLRQAREQLQEQQAVATDAATAASAAALESTRALRVHSEEISALHARLEALEQLRREHQGDVADLRQLLDRARESREATERTLAAKTLAHEQLGSEMGQVKATLARAQGQLDAARADATAAQGLAATRLGEVQSLQTRLAEQALALQSAQQREEDQSRSLREASENLERALGALGDSGSRQDALQGELEAAKARATELTKEAAALQMMVASAREDAERGATQARRTLADRSHELDEARERADALTLAKNEAEARAKEGEKARATLQAKLDGEVAAHVAERTKLALDLARAERLYEDTCQQQHTYSDTTAKESKRLAAELAAAKGQAELLQTALRVAQVDASQLGDEHERLAGKHRQVIAALAEANRRIDVLEAREADMTSKARDALLAQQRAAAALQPIPTAAAEPALAAAAAGIVKPATPSSEEMEKLRRHNSSLADQLAEERRAVQVQKLRGDELANQCATLQAQYNELLARMPYKVGAAPVATQHRVSSSLSQASNPTPVGGPYHVMTSGGNGASSSLSSVRGTSGFSSESDDAVNLRTDRVGHHSLASSRDGYPGAQPRRLSRHGDDLDTGRASSISQTSNISSGEEHEAAGSSATLMGTVRPITQRSQGHTAIVLQTPEGSRRSVAGAPTDPMLLDELVPQQLQQRDVVPRSESEIRELTALPPRASAPVPHTTAVVSDDATASTAAPTGATTALTPAAALQQLSAIPLAVGLLFSESAAGDAASPSGVVVTAVKSSQSADAAGIRVGDLISSLNGRATHSKAAFLLALRGVRPGDRLPVVGMREGRELTLTMIVGGRGHTDEQISTLRRQAGIDTAAEAVH